MRFQSMLAFAGLAAAMEAPEDGNQYVAQFQGMVADTFGSFIPSPNKYDPVAHEEAKTGDKKMTYITLDNWKQTLYDPVQEGATEPETTWMLVTGRNKTCWGHCETIEAAWNESAVILAQRENPPRMAMLNCEDQPILCNSWSAGTGIVWAFDMLPPPAENVIHIKRLNYTTVTPDVIIDLIDNGKEDKMKVHQGAFHPFNGWIAKYQLSLPIGCVLWALNTVPNWAFMLLISFFSRSFMNRSMAQAPAAPRPAAPAAPAAN